MDEDNIEFFGSSDEDFMVLNLISRKTYWVKVNPLAVKLKYVLITYQIRSQFS